MKVVPRLMLGLCLLPLLLGPTPGQVGGCQDEVGPVSAQDFCVDRERWTCARFRALCEAPSGVCLADERACVDAVPDRCAGIDAWPQGCAPTTVQTEACLAELMSPEFIDLAPSDLPSCQCQALCGSGSPACGEGAR